MKNRPNVLAGDMLSEEMKIFNRNKHFENGAKWADENPKEGIVRIKRVCDWIEDNVFEYQYTEDGNTIFDADKFIDDLCKAMEG